MWYNKFKDYKQSIIEDSAYVIQSAWREYLRKEVQYSYYVIECAKNIQRVYRGYKGRQIYNGLLFEKKKELSALTIQCAYRSYIGRRIYKALLRKKIEYIMACRIRIAWRIALRKLNKKVNLIIKVWNIYKEKKERECIKSAIIIQKRVRGIL